MNRSPASAPVVLVVSAFLSLSPALVGCASMHGDEGGDEVTVTIAQVPPAVRASLERESAGGTITEIERETKGGMTVYSADIEISGIIWDVSVAEDGKVLSKTRE